MGSRKRSVHVPRNRNKDDKLQQAAQAGTRSNAGTTGSAKKASKRSAAKAAKAQANTPSAATLTRARSTEHYQAKRKGRSRKKVLRVTLIVVAVLVLGCAGAAWAYMNNIQSRLSSGLDSNLSSNLTETAAGDPFYMLLMGIDKSWDRAESSEYGESDSAYRTDSILLARIDPANKRVTLVSIHRDTLVNLGSNGKQKINAAYSIGGASYAVSTISEFAGVPISHYAEIDFDQFCSIVDTIGGIDVNVPVACYDPDYTGAHIDAGEQTLNGEQALQLCRARHAYDSYGDGDLYRAANQRMVIAAIIKKIMTEDLASMTATVSDAANSISTDMSVTDILSLANSFRGMNVDENVYSGMNPTTSEYVNSTWYEISDNTAWKKMMTRVDDGLSPYENASDDPSQGIAGTTDTINNGDSSSTTSSSSSSSATTSYSGTVEVLNGSGVSGYAGRISSSLSSLGFTATSGNASGTYSTTVIVYNGSEHEAQAKAVAQALGGEISVKANDGTYDTTTNVVVILGSDMNTSTH